jgi:plasmid stabilization system protein ParE
MMARTLVWTAMAEQDLEDAIAYLEAQEVGLGMALLAEVTQVVGRVLAMPHVYPEIEPGMRRALVRRFSYNLFYVLPDEDTIEVHALIHTAANPDDWPTG